MNKIADSKGVYAQSSDVKSRTYLQYRADMKRKAIVELEVINWFEGKLKELRKTVDVTVKKSGGDAHIWFLRSGRISGDPDYVAKINGEIHRFEFQYASKSDLPFYDFKVSKVGKKVKGKRIPYSDRSFLYILMASNQFAVFTPEWIVQNGEEAGVPAWGNRTAFRVPLDKFMEIFHYDGKLIGEIELVEKKIRLLNLQTLFMQNESRRLSTSIENIVDREEIFEIIPRTLDGFYKACFLMDKIGKFPKNHLLWLVYGSSFYLDQLSSRELARLIYSLDFLYGGSDDLESNVINSFVETMQKIAGKIVSIQKHEFQTSSDLSPKEEIVNFLFTVNLYEDIVQELRYLYGVDCFDPISTIFQTIDDLDSIFERFQY